MEIASGPENDSPRIKKGSILGKCGTDDRFQSGIPQRWIIRIPDDDRLEVVLDCGSEIFEENAGAVHAGQQHQCDHPSPEETLCRVARGSARSFGRGRNRGIFPLHRDEL